MRKILFRGKTEETQEWIYGDLLIDGPKDCSIREDRCTVRYDIIPETVGQYTGLTDMNGVKIFEGDIVKELSDFNSVGVIEYNRVNASFSKKQLHYNEIRNLNQSLCYEVIGNIHDNPEMLKGEE